MKFPISLLWEIKQVFFPAIWQCGYLSEWQQEKLILMHGCLVIFMRGSRKTPGGAIRGLLQ